MQSNFSALLAVLMLAAIPAGPSRASPTDEAEVDVALVLAVDVSRSMDPDEQTLQRDGYVKAFRSRQVHDAIGQGSIGRIAVVYFEWSGPYDQTVVVPWTVIDSPERAVAFSDHLADAPVGRILSTSISGAI